MDCVPIKSKGSMTSQIHDTRVYSPVPKQQATNPLVEPKSSKVLSRPSMLQKILD